MRKIIEVLSPLGKVIRLTDTQWFHVLKHHNEIEGQLEGIKETIARPDKILYDKREENYHYCKYYSNTPVSSKYMLVIVKHLNSEGFIITSFFIARLKRETVDLVRKIVVSYDKEADVMYMSFDRSKKAVAVEVESGVYARLMPKSRAIAGFTILNFSKKFTPLRKEIEVSIPG